MAIVKSVLIVDDEPDIREFLTYNLTKKGYHVRSAENGSIALELALIKVPDLILMDIMMPMMNGFETCRKLRENKILNDTYIILLSAMSESLARTAGHHIFVDDFIAKPVSIKELLVKIDKVFELND